MDVRKELIIVVDKDDNIVGYKTQEEVDKENLIYRVTALWVTNSNGDILLGKRSKNKKHNPSVWICAVAGTVEKGESYDDSIIKETEEEIGIKITSPIKGPKTFSDKEYTHFTQWYTLIIDRHIEEFSFDNEEIEELKWFTKEELNNKLKSNPEKFIEKMPYYFDMFNKK